MARPAPAASRAVQILDLLVAHPGQRFTLSELVRRTGASLGSAHAVLAVLTDAGYVTRDPSTLAYSLGPALVVAGVVALEQQPAIRAACDAIGPLAEQLGLETVVSARTAGEIIFVARAGDHRPHGPQLREGERVPLVPPLGGVFMAWAPPDDVTAWLARGPGDDPELARRYREGLEVVRARGYAVAAASDTQRTFGEHVYALAGQPARTDLRDDLGDLLARLADDAYTLDALDHERTYDVGMVAAPVFDGGGAVVAAVTATGFAPARTADEVVRACELVRDCASVVTRQTRGRPPA